MKEYETRRRLILPLDMEGVSTFPGAIITDPFGSYTGLVADMDEKPVQDADDL